MARRSRKPQVESLEARVALSAGGITALVKPHHLSLNGEVSGSFQLAPGIPDTGPGQTLTGSGTVAPLGRLNASGTLHSPGFIATGRATGRFTFTNASGTVTIALSGPIQRGFAVLPSHLSFKIVAATGRYAGTTDSGRATLFEAEADAVPPPNGSSPGVIVGPIFGLTLHSS